jgi:hypothetical protein
MGGCGYCVGRFGDMRIIPGAGLVALGRAGQSERDCAQLAAAAAGGTVEGGVG